MHRRADGRNANGLNLRQVYGGGIRKRYSPHGYQSYRPSRYPGSSVRYRHDRPHVGGGVHGHLDRDLDDYLRLRRKGRVNLTGSDAADLRGRLDDEIDDYMSKRKEQEKLRRETDNNAAPATVVAVAVADADAGGDGISEAKRREISAELESFMAEDGLDLGPEIMETEVEMVS
ncbi:hypothetical protein HDU87_003752 [Geranomyces variabilis]|uniref:Uncharacterized protein n=1 Tax=Geranomyces variabilis TaxID=109894 RepID=A0AAD5TJ84_9FUNG|nr:hypothetical protein HDU87_003752 [Geranomyces variabilis]